jgi:hypothetical protein
LQNPFLGVDSRPLYASKGPLAAQLAKNLEKNVGDLFSNGQTLVVTDKGVFGEKPILVKVVLKEGAIYTPKFQE